MKTSDILILGGLGAAIYFLSKNRGSPEASGSAFVDSGSGFSFTPQNVAQAQAGGMSNAAIVESATNAIANAPKVIKVAGKGGNTRTVSLPPAGSTKTSINKNQYLAPRVGGGYSVVGARNIVLR